MRLLPKPFRGPRDLNKRSGGGVGPKKYRNAVRMIFSAQSRRVTIGNGPRLSYHGAPVSG